MSDRASFVLLLKSPSKDGPDSYVKALEAVGLDAMCLPVLDFEFVNISDLAQCLLDHEGYSGMILTSPRAVEAVTMAAESLRDSSNDILKQWKQKSTFVVGEATGRDASKLGLDPQGAESGNAETLVPLILNTPGIDPDSLPLLFPVSALARDIIPTRLTDAGVGYNQLTIYKTVPKPGICDSLRKTMDERMPSQVVFFSPSGLDFTWEIWKQLGVDLSALNCVAIGPTTQKALVDRGLHPAVAAKPTPANLVAALNTTQAAK